jgi:multisubunit Na+/H+ antiporter MnhB subunit
LRGQFVESNTTVPVEVVPDEQKVVSKDPGVAIPAVTTGAVSVLALGEAAAKLEPLAEFSDTIRSIFVGLTLLGVLVTLFLGMKKRKDAQKENV